MRRNADADAGEGTNVGLTAGFKVLPFDVGDRLGFRIFVTVGANMGRALGRGVVNRV